MNSHTQSVAFFPSIIYLKSFSKSFGWKFTLFLCVRRWEMKVSYFLSILFQEKNLFEVVQIYIHIEQMYVFFLVLPSWNCGHFTAIIRGAFFSLFKSNFVRHYSDRIELNIIQNIYIFFFVIFRINIEYISLVWTIDRQVVQTQSEKKKKLDVFFFLFHSLQIS